MIVRHHKHVIYFTVKSYLFEDTRRVPDETSRIVKIKRNMKIVTLNMKSQEGELKVVSRMKKWKFPDFNISRTSHMIYRR